MTKFPLPGLRIAAALLASLGLALAACGGDPEPTAAPPVDLPTVTVGAQPTDLPQETLPETDTTEEAASLERPLYSGPSICPQGGGEPPSIEPAAFETGVIEHFESQFIGYLNQTGSAEGLAERLEGFTLEDGSTTWLSTSNVYTADVTGDDVPEVLIDLVFYVSGQYADGGIYIFGCGENEYVTIETAWIGGQAFAGGGPEAGIVAVEDFSGDGVAEIVTSSIEAMGTAANYQRGFRIIGWDGEAFSNLLYTDQSDLGSVTVENGEGDILDTDEDGLPELVLRSKVGGHPDTSPLERDRTEKWGWDGLQIARLCSTADTPPEFRYQAIMDGDDATLCGDFDAALAFYQQAIFDEELEPWTSRYKPGLLPSEDAVEPDALERANLGAYGRYRILLLHAARGFLAEARIVYDSLQEKFPGSVDGHAYAAMAAALWEAFNEDDFSSGCSAAIDYAMEHSSEILSPIGREKYDWPAPELSPLDICPQNALALES